jgi:hypothetical protein
VIRVRWLVLVVISAALAPEPAQADEMDLMLRRLGNPELATTGADFAWRRLMSQFGASMAPPVLEPAHTVGPGGFHAGVETWVTGIDSGQTYWGIGTEGDDPQADRNRFVKDAYTWFRVNLRKGLPFGFELGAQAGHAMHTNYWAWGASLKWSLFEGFRTGIGYLPDVAVRAAVHTLTGASEFNLTVPSLDLIISKPFVIAKTLELTPIVAGQLAWIMADSEVVDLSPGTNPFDECDPLPPDPMRQPNTCTGSADGFNALTVFSQVRSLRTRLVMGLQLRYLALTLTGSFAFDMIQPGDLDGDLVTYTQPDGTEVSDSSFLPRQWTASLAVGFSY